MISTKPAAQTLINDAASYQGFYLRNNIGSNATLPAQGPYDVCPDIIQSIAALTNPAQTLGTASAWNNTYNVAPDTGNDNYYYVRGKNPMADTQKDHISLYYMPAQLVPLPQTWQTNQIMAQNGKKTIPLNAAPNAIAVTSEAFLWPNTPAPAGADFYSFVAQVNDVANHNPIPTISTWMDMSALLTQNLGFGFRSTCQVEANATSWKKNFKFTIPAGISPLSTLQMVISYAGMQGNELSLTSTPGLGVTFQPFIAGQNNQNTAMTFQAPASYDGTLTLTYTNKAGSFPQPGAAITVSVYYSVPPDQLHTAGVRGLLQHQASLALTEPGMPVNHYVIIGSLTFAIA